MCLFKKKDRKPKRVRVILSDGKRETKAQRKRRERALRELGKEK